MRVKYSYSKTDLEATVKFISQNNNFFLGQDEYIRHSVLTMIMNHVESFPQCPIMGTMGFYIEGNVVETESMSEDENILHIGFLVDPSLGLKYGMSDEEMEQDTVTLITEI